MTLSDLLKYCQFMLAQNQKGNSISVDNYNVSLRFVNIEMYGDELKKLLALEAAPAQIKREALLNSPLNKFTKGAGANTTSFAVPSGARIWTVIATKATGELVPVDVYTERQIMVMRTSVFNVDVQKYPIGVLRGSSLDVIGEGVSSMEISYLLMPTMPFYDYCIDSYDSVIYMPEGSYLAQSAGVTNLYDQSGALLTANVTHTNGLTAYTSQTVELEWDERFHDDFAYRLLEKFGLNIRDVQVLQFSQIKKQEGA